MWRRAICRGNNKRKEDKQCHHQPPLALASEKWVSRLQQRTSDPLLDRLGLSSSNPVKAGEKGLLVLLLGDLAVLALLRLPSRPFASLSELHHTGLGGVDIALVRLLEEAVELVREGRGRGISRRPEELANAGPRT